MVQNGWLMSREKGQEQDRENVITICKVARLEFRPRRESRVIVIDYFATISCIHSVRDGDGL